MGLIARFLGAVSKGERVGIRLEEAEPWRISPTRDLEGFLRALPRLVPEGAVAYFEATGEPHVAEYLRGVSIPPQAQVAVGTIWPRPDFYHVPISEGSMQALTDFLEKRPAGFFCSHCHVYRNGVLLLQWHDVVSDPLYVSRTISEPVVREFARTLNCMLASGW